MQGEIQSGTGVDTPIKEKETKYKTSGVKDRALELYENGMNPSEITKKLTEEGFECSDEGIRQMLLNNSKVRKNVISDIQLAKKFKDMVLDYEKELKTIFDEINEVKAMAKNEKEYNAYSALVGRMLQGIELFSKIAGDFKEQKIDINVIIGEIDNRVRASKGIFEEPIDINAVIIEDDKRIAKSKEEQ